MKVNAGFKIEEEMRLKMLYIADHESIAYADLCRVSLLELIKRFEKEHGRITKVMLQQTSYSSKPQVVEEKTTNDSKNRLSNYDPTIRDFMENLVK